MITITNEFLKMVLDTYNHQNNIVVSWKWNNFGDYVMVKFNECHKTKVLCFSKHHLRSSYPKYKQLCTEKFHKDVNSILELK